MKQQSNVMTIRRKPKDYNISTLFGIFPCNWETAKTFGDLFDFAMGGKGLVIDYEQQ